MKALSKKYCLLKTDNGNTDAKYVFGKASTTFLCILCLILLGAVYIQHSFNIFDLQESNNRFLPLETTEKATVVPDAVCSSVVAARRFDCHPEPGAEARACKARGCCWLAGADPDEGRPPFCFYSPEYGGYRYLNVTEHAHGVDAYLTRVFPSPYARDVRLLKLTVAFETENRVRIKYTDAEHERYEAPYPEVPVVQRRPHNCSYSVHIDPLASGFRILRNIDQTVIFDTMNVGAMIYADQFLQLSALLPSHHIYGLGEHYSNLLLSTQWQTFTMFNVDQFPVPNSNLYGSHPMYLMMETSGNAHGVFLLNSNAMEVVLQPAPAITFRMLGGVIDLYVLLGPTPGLVVRQYTDLVGRALMPPQWALGFHLCRFGYRTLARTQEVWARTLAADIPLDVQWNDLDYMADANDFTYNRSTFQRLPQFVDKLHTMRMHYVPIVDPGISGSELPGTYPPYDIGLAMGVFVKNSSGLPFVGKVWNRASTVWPDFTHPNTTAYWTRMLRSLHDSFQYDGAWIDMNEPSNFVSGSVDMVGGCPGNSRFEHPAYVPPMQGGRLFHHTMCMTCQHYAGAHYDLHNLFGFTEAMLTYRALAEIRGKRPFVISRSTFPGIGRFAGHWSGDVYSTWDDMRLTIPHLLSFSLFGVPLMGADICGFNGNTTAALCNRWMQLGAFYPFARNHNTDDAIDQDPVALGPDVVRSSRKALTIRYSLLPYLYTLFWKAHTQGDTVARPLFFEFVNDINTYQIDDQFLWGASIMITPVLKENATMVSAYFPAGVWYYYETFAAVTSAGETRNVSASLDTIPVFVRGGAIIPKQTAQANVPLTRTSPIQLLAAADQQEQAQGLLYWDDGDSLNSVEELRFSLVEFEMEAGVLRTHATRWCEELDGPPPLDYVIVLGVQTPVVAVTVNRVAHHFVYNGTAKSLSIENINITLKNPVLIQWH